MITFYDLAFFCVLLFSVGAAGFLFSGNMLKKLLFAAVMFLAAGVSGVCLIPNDNPSGYLFSILILSIAELASSLAIIAETVKSLRTLDSGAVRGKD